MNINFKTIATIGGAALLYYRVLRGASALYVGIKNYRFGSISLANNTAEFIITFLLNNPLYVGLRLKAISGDIYIQGIKCGTINANYDRYLAGRHAWNVAVPITIDLGQLASAVVENISTGNINTLTISFDGAIVIGGTGLVRIPFSKTLSYDDLTK